MHRDYSDPGGHIALAVFDDRIEIRSSGRLPAGLTVEMLSGPHLSKLRNPLIADTFHRTGAVEIWGRGTNRVIDECKRYGITPPLFEELQGYLVVTFRASIGPELVHLGTKRPKGSQKGSPKVHRKFWSKSRDNRRSPLTNWRRILGSVRAPLKNTSAILRRRES